MFFQNYLAFLLYEEEKLLFGPLFFHKMNRNKNEQGIKVSYLDRASVWVGERQEVECLRRTGRSIPVLVMWRSLPASLRPSTLWIKGVRWHADYLVLIAVRTLDRHTSEERERLVEEGDTGASQRGFPVRYGILTPFREEKQLIVSGEPVPDSYGLDFSLSPRVKKVISYVPGSLDPSQSCGFRLCVNILRP